MKSDQCGSKRGQDRMELVIEMAKETLKSVWKYIKNKNYSRVEKLEQSKNGQTVALIHLGRSQVCCWWLKNQKRDSKSDRNMA